MKNEITANLIREARLKAGLTQVQAAQHTGVPRRTLQNWEAGINTPPEYVIKMVLERIVSLK
ncbi:MAG: helix-turn-helix domain-containing protein [Oscillospiraceae bacterium]|jgi:DNA-binding XRE family transcriptional regulator|nr:helix-turn-helix domain-containing protein [Oscillospiraceae bacterium]